MGKTVERANRDSSENKRMMVVQVLRHEFGTVRRVEWYTLGQISVFGERQAGAKHEVGWWERLAGYSR